MGMLWSWCGGVRGQADGVGWSWRQERKEERLYHDTTHHAAHPHMHISTLVPKGVLCAVGMSMLSSASGLHPICTMCTVPNHKVPTYAHQLNSLLPFPHWP